jgi:hypothetical protein
MAEFGPASANTITAPFWAAAREHRLVLPFDPATGKACWYPREDGTAYEWREVAGNATLYSFSVVRGPINPLFEPTYAPGLVELDAVPGVRLVTQIVDCEFDAIHCGMPLELCFRERHPRGHAAFIAPVFRPRS